jgi:hypothetical protein
VWCRTPLVVGVWCWKWLSRCDCTDGLLAFQAACLALVKADHFHFGSDRLLHSILHIHMYIGSSSQTTEIT